MTKAPELDTRALAELQILEFAEDNAFDRASRIADDPKTARNRAQNCNASQEWFGAVSEYLERYLELAYGHEVQAPPPLVRMASLARSLSKGKTPDPIRFAAAEDGNYRWPGETRDVAMAVFYARAAKSNEIQDKTYNKTVREAFDVQAQTVRNWISDGDSICKGLISPPVESLREAMLEAGERFRCNRTGRKAGD